MKISIEKSALSEGLQQVINVAGSKTSLPIIQNVLLETSESNKLNLTTTNMDISIRCTVVANVESHGAITVPVKKFLSIIRALPENTVQLEVNNLTINIQSGGSRFKMLCLPASEFPQVQIIQNTGTFEVEQTTLLHLLKSISYAQSKDENRYLMNGVYFSVQEEQLCLIATDGRRLSLNKCEFTKSEGLQNVIVPAKTISELERTLGIGEKVTVSITDKQIGFQIEIAGDNKSGLIDNLYILSKIVEGKYPNYKQVIPSTCEHRLRLDREKFLEVIQRVALVSDDKNYTIKMNIEPGAMILSAQSTTYGEAREKMIIDYSENEVEIGFNPQFLCDPLKAIADEEMFFEFKDSVSPGIIKGKDAFLCVVMPLRI